MIEDGLFFGSQMHWARVFVIALELFFIIHQSFKCLEKPEDKRRQRYLLLLLLILSHNIIEGFFPDKNINIPIVGQRLLCYAGRLAVLAYCPFYFYKSFAISALRFHARWGIWLFLIGPFVFLFTSSYALTSNMNLATTCGIAISIPYSFISVFAMGAAIYKKYKNKLLGNSKEVILLLIAIVHWGLLVVISTIEEMSQLVELALANVGFLLFCVFYVKEEFRGIRIQDSDIQLMDDIIEEQNNKILYLEGLRKAETIKDIEHIEPDVSNFEETKKDISTDDLDEDLFDEHCAPYLTSTQTEVEKMSNQELSDKEIAEARGVKEDSIKKPMNDIIEEQNDKILYLEGLRKTESIKDIEHIEPSAIDFEETKQDISDDDFDEDLFDMSCAKFLTSVQTEVVNMINQGLSYKEIANVREVKEGSIKKIVSSVRLRLKAKRKSDILLKLKSKKYYLSEGG